MKAPFVWGADGGQSNQEKQYSHHSLWRSDGDWTGVPWHLPDSVPIWVQRCQAGWDLREQSLWEAPRFRPHPRALHQQLGCEGSMEGGEPQWPPACLCLAVRDDRVTPQPWPRWGLSPCTPRCPREEVGRSLPVLLPGTLLPLPPPEHCHCPPTPP